MPIEIHWANNDQSIMIEKFYDVWTWQQVADTCQNQINPALENITHPLVLIQEMIGSHWTPTTNLLQEVEQMMQTPYADHVAAVLVVSGSAAIDTLVIAAYNRYGSPNCTYKSCKTVNEAIQFASTLLS